MQKNVILTLALCLPLAGCQLFKSSPTWAQVTRVAKQSHEARPEEGFITRLHETLLESGTEHRVVTFQHGYANRRDGRGTAIRVAVIYRDEAHPERPWWLAERAAEKPVWLEGESVEAQLRHFLPWPVEVLKVDDFQGRVRPAARLAMPAVPADRPTAVTSIEPADGSERPGFLRQIGEGLRAIPRYLGFRRQQPSTEPAPAAREPDFPALFRARHGTEYDSGSAVDRRKMKALQAAAC